MNIVTLLRGVLECCIEKYQLPSVVLKFGKRGQTRQDSQSRWLVTIRAYWHQPEELAIATLLHEIAHVIQCVHHIYTHNKQFRDTERVLLADFGLVPIGYNQRGSWYVTLQTLNGNQSWHRAVAWNQSGLIEGDFAVLKPVKSQTPVQPRPQTQARQRRKKKIPWFFFKEQHRAFHPRP